MTLSRHQTSYSHIVTAQACRDQSTRSDYFRYRDISFFSSIGMKRKPTSSPVCHATEQLRRGPNFEERTMTRVLGSSISLSNSSLAPPAETSFTAPKQMNLFSRVINAAKTPTLRLGLALLLFSNMSGPKNKLTCSLIALRLPGPTCRELSRSELLFAQSLPSV
jgi:hypothetical protein